jgi:hypothetical protein
VSRFANLEQIVGSKVTVEDYPYSFNLRCTKNYWIESKPGKGQRLATQTINPKTGKPNAVKYSTYSPMLVLTKAPETGYVQQIAWSPYDGEEGLDAFVEAFELDEYQRKVVPLWKGAYARKKAVAASRAELNCNSA